jgi:hypothetical protein
MQFEMVTKVLWDDDQVERLKFWISETRLSYTRIAKEMEAEFYLPFTGGMIAGKVNRLKISSTRAVSNGKGGCSLEDSSAKPRPSPVKRRRPPPSTPATGPAAGAAACQQVQEFQPHGPRVRRRGPGGPAGRQVPVAAGPRGRQAALPVLRQPEHRQGPTLLRRPQQAGVPATRAQQAQGLGILLEPALTRKGDKP